MYYLCTSLRSTCPTLQWRRQKPETFASHVKVKVKAAHQLAPFFVNNSKAPETRVQFGIAQILPCHPHASPQVECRANYLKQALVRKFPSNHIRIQLTSSRCSSELRCISCNVNTTVHIFARESTRITSLTNHKQLNLHINTLSILYLSLCFQVHEQACITGGSLYCYVR